MTLITDTWRQLVRRRLWPVALLLLAAAVAVPVLLAKDPAPEPLPPLPGPTAATQPANDVLMGTPVVTPATTSDARRHVLGDRKDVFRPAVVAKATPAPNQTSTGTSSSGGAGTGGSSTPSPGTTSPSAPSGGGTTTPAPPSTGTGTPAPKPKHYPADSLTVRFGSGEGDPKTVLEKGDPLPADSAAEATPLLVYTGLSRDGTEALFLVDASVKADGDGRCVSGGGTSCETLRLRAGETEFLDVSDEAGKVTGQFELDVLAIHAADRKPAKAARARASAAVGGVASVGRVALGAGLAALLGGL